MIRYHQEVRPRLDAGPRFTLADLGAPWRGRAACADKWELFDAVDYALSPPGRMGDARRRELDEVIDEARALCASCPVFAECKSAVVAPGSPSHTHSYSIIAGEDHITYNPNYKGTPRYRQQQKRDNLRRRKEEGEKCETCNVRYLNLDRHRPVHDTPVKEHGTRNGYDAHRKRREDACDSCKEAMRIYVADQRAIRAQRMVV